MTDLARELGKTRAPWVRLHYVYPYPHVDSVIPLMAEGLVLPYLDIPFQHASPKVLKRDEAPGQRGQGARSASATGASRCPTSPSARASSSASPARPRRISHYLLDWLEEAQLDRVGAFRFEPVEGAAANALPDQVPEEVKEERYARVMELTARISAEKLAAKVGRRSTCSSTRSTTRPAARPAAPRPTRRRSTARSTCATPASQARRHRPRPRRGRRRARPVRRAGGDRRRLAVKSLDELRDLLIGLEVDDLAVGYRACRKHRNLRRSTVPGHPNVTDEFRQ